MPRRLATQQKAAAHYGVTDRTIRSWVSEGLIHGFRLPSGRAIRVDLDEIDSMLQEIPTVTRQRGPYNQHPNIVDLRSVVGPEAREAEGVGVDGGHAR